MKTSCNSAIAYIQPFSPPTGRASDSVLRDLGNGLGVSYVVEDGGSLAFLQYQHLQEAGLSLEQMHDIGIRNLRKRAVEGKFRLEKRGAVHVALVDGNFEASMLLINELWDRELISFIQRGFLIAIPAPNVLAFCDVRSDEGNATLRQMVKPVADDGKRVLSDSLYRRQGNGWVAVAEKPASAGNTAATVKPSAAAAVDPELAQLQSDLRFNAEELRRVAREHMQVEVDYDLAGMRWLDGYIQRQHEKGDPATFHGQMNTLGAFFGECIIRNIGGEWARNEEYETVWVRFDDNNGAFPFNKVKKHLHNGAEEGDSVLGMYESLSVMRKYETQSRAATPPSASTDPAMQDIISSLRTSFGKTQKVMNARIFDMIRAANPHWLQASDPLSEIGKQQLRLCKEGKIVWGSLVQANKLMFSAGNEECPGLLVYSPDAYFDARTDELAKLGSRIFSLKNTQPTDPAERKLADMVTDEMDRAMGWKLPPVMTARDVRTAAFLVFRKHIPNGILSNGLFPILIHPATQAVMIVPFEFWPKELILLWKQGKL